MTYLVIDIDGYEQTRVYEGSDRLSPHFTVEELACRNKCEIVVYSSETLNLVEFVHDKVAEKVGKRVPLYVSSAFRTPAYNKAVGGKDDSMHMRGAIDILTPAGLTTAEFAEIVLDVTGYVSGVGVSLDSLFVHIDNRNYHARWSYNGDTYDFKGR